MLVGIPCGKKNHVQISKLQKFPKREQCGISQKPACSFLDCIWKEWGVIYLYFLPEFRLWRYLYVVLSRLSRIIAQPNIFITIIKFYRYHLALSYRVTEPFDEYSKFDMRYSVFEYRTLSNIERYRISNLFESFRYLIGRFIKYRISNPDRICRKLVYKSSRRGAKWARGNGKWAPAGGRPYPTLRH